MYFSNLEIFKGMLLSEGMNEVNENLTVPPKIFSRSDFQLFSFTFYYLNSINLGKN